MEERILSQLESVVVVKMEDQQSLCEAFRGCHAIFHTSSFIDPHGVSGYNEQMAFLETLVAMNVIEACAEVAYVKRCVFTSSLLASVWQAYMEATAFVCPCPAGAHMMLQNGVLATVDLEKVAEAHVRVYEAMNHGASGRYHCFDRVITKLNEAIELGKGVMRMEGPFPEEEEFCSRVSNSKLKRLLL